MAHHLIAVAQINLNDNDLQVVKGEMVGMKNTEYVFYPNRN